MVKHLSNKLLKLNYVVQVVPCLEKNIKGYIYNNQDFS